MKVKGSPIMPTGWHYMQGDVRIDGKNDKDVPVQMSLYRLHLALDRPTLPECEEDFINYVCTKWPKQCSANENAVKALILAAGKATRPKLMNRIAYWAGNVFKHSSLKLVTSDIAAQRAEICKDCPKNRKWDTCKPCGDFIKETNRILLLMRQGNPGFGLMGCETCGHENNTAVWMDNFLARGTEAPEQCWVNK